MRKDRSYATIHDFYGGGHKIKNIYFMFNLAAIDLYRD